MPCAVLPLEQRECTVQVSRSLAAITEITVGIAEYVVDLRLSDGMVVEVVVDVGGSVSQHAARGCGRGVIAVPGPGLDQKLGHEVDQRPRRLGLALDLGVGQTSVGLGLARPRQLRERGEQAGDQTGERDSDPRHERAIAPREARELLERSGSTRGDRLPTQHAADVRRELGRGRVAPFAVLGESLRGDRLEITAQRAVERAEPRRLLFAEHPDGFEEIDFPATSRGNRSVSSR